VVHALSEPDPTYDWDDCMAVDEGRPKFVTGFLVEDDGTFVLPDYPLPVQTRWPLTNRCFARPGACSITWGSTLADWTPEQMAPFDLSPPGTP
jgi:hypothetical protein